MTDTAATPCAPQLPPCNVTRWRVATAACLMLLVIAGATQMSMYEQFKAQIGHLQTKLKTAPQLRYVSVLLDDRHMPAQLITFDPKDNFVQIQRLNDVNEGSAESLQLRAIPVSGKPRSLSVVSVRVKTAQLPVTSDMLENINQLANSVESKGGAESGSEPRLPYLFSGVLIQKAL